MDHMRISGTKPSSVILNQKSSLKIEKMRSIAEKTYLRCSLD